MGKTSSFDVVVGIDMETDIGSFTSFYQGVQKGTPRLLEVLDKHEAKATFFWTGHAAQSNPAMVRQVRSAGHVRASATASSAAAAIRR
jgi:peptidoglycan/xylan/chitin deacetylase (PgdA/CDA1 family)